MAKYEMREMPDLLRTGKTVLYPRLVVERQQDSRTCCRLAAQGSTYSEGELRGMLDEMAGQLERSLAEGCSVKLDGLGTFSLRLRLAEGAERETTTRKGSRRNARSICVTGVSFRPERSWVKRIDERFRPERQSATGRLKPSPYSPEERRARALMHLDTHGWLRVSDYMALTGLSHTRAAGELRMWAAEPDTALRITGRGSHRAYLKRS